MWPPHWLLITLAGVLLLLLLCYAQIFLHSFNLDQGVSVGLVIVSGCGHCAVNFNVEFDLGLGA